MVVPPVAAVGLGGRSGRAPFAATLKADKECGTALCPQALPLGDVLAVGAAAIFDLGFNVVGNLTDGFGHGKGVVIGVILGVVFCDREGWQRAQNNGTKVHCLNGWHLPLGGAETANEARVATLGAESLPVGIVITNNGAVREGLALVSLLATNVVINQVGLVLTDLGLVLVLSVVSRTRQGVGGGSAARGAANEADSVGSGERGARHVHRELAGLERWQGLCWCNRVNLRVSMGFVAREGVRGVDVAEGRRSAGWLGTAARLRAWCRTGHGTGNR